MKLAESDADFLGAPVTVCGGVGDQQSALFGQLCAKPGLVKCTLWHGLLHARIHRRGPVASRNRLITTVAWKLDGAPLQYAIEGCALHRRRGGPMAARWPENHSLRAEVNDLAAQVADTAGVVLVPAIHRPRRAVIGIPRRAARCSESRAARRPRTSRRATLEGIAFQCRRPACRSDGEGLRSQNFHAARRWRRERERPPHANPGDLIGVPVERPSNVETPRSAPRDGGLGAGVWRSVEELGQMRAVDRTLPFTTMCKGPPRAREDLAQGQ